MNILSTSSPDHYLEIIIIIILIVTTIASATQEMKIYLWLFERINSVYQINPNQWLGLGESRRWHS